MACGYLLVAGFVNVNLIVSPCVTRTTGPGICPLNVQAAYFSPPPSITTSVSTAVMATSWVLALAGAEDIAPATAEITRPMRKAIRAWGRLNMESPCVRSRCYLNVMSAESIPKGQSAKYDQSHVLKF